MNEGIAILLIALGGVGLVLSLGVSRRPMEERLMEGITGVTGASEPLCDHWIGISLVDEWAPPFRESDIPRVVAIKQQTADAWTANPASTYSYLRRGQGLTAKGMLRSELKLFRHCPECGALLPDYLKE